MPPPTGVVNGPLMPTKYFLNASTVSSGSQFWNVGFVHRGIEHAHARSPDVGTGAIAFDERNNRIVGYDQPRVFQRDRGAGGWRRQRSGIRHDLQWIL
jgi:hypothetical protein